MGVPYNIRRIRSALHILKETIVQITERKRFEECDLEDSRNKISLGCVNDYVLAAGLGQTHQDVVVESGAAGGGEEVLQVGLELPVGLRRRPHVAVRRIHLQQGRAQFEAAVQHDLSRLG